jgi:hypothetical protein
MTKKKCPYCGGWLNGLHDNDCPLANGKIK